MSNTFGDSYKLTIFGDSHGTAIGGVIDGMVPGFMLDEKKIQRELDRRKGGKDFFSTARKEADKVEFLSGIVDGHTTGGPIGFVIQNKNSKGEDYKALDNIFRPSHADFTYYAKYGSQVSAGKLHASGRLFASVVVGGAIATQFLTRKKITLTGFTHQIGHVRMPGFPLKVKKADVDNSIVQCPNRVTSAEMLQLLKEAYDAGDTLGGVISVVISGCPAGLGDPTFGKLQAQLAHAMLSIPSVKGFEYGQGFSASAMKGTLHNDAFVIKKGMITTAANTSGGLLGGISTGEDIYFSVAFKPISSHKQMQDTVNRQAQNVAVEIGGRHDVCMVPRAIPIVESLAAIVIMDSYLKNLKYV